MPRPKRSEQRVLLVSGSTDELLLLRRVVLDTPFLVETRRSIREAIDALAETRFTAVIVDEELRGAGQLLDDVGLRRPETLRVLIGRADVRSLAPEGAHRCARPRYAAEVRALLLERAVHTVEFDAEDDTLQMVPGHLKKPKAPE